MLIQITIENYEAFYLDYLEGNLSAQETAQLLLFLEKNPSLKTALQEIELIELPSTPTITTDKTSLYQHINLNNADDYIIAELEGIGNKDDQHELIKLRSTNKEFEQLFQRYQNTILPITPFAYPQKEKLKKRGAIIYSIAPVIGIAASILLFFFTNDSTTIPSENVAKTNYTQPLKVKSNKPADKTTIYNQIAINDSFGEKKPNQITNSPTVPVRVHQSEHLVSDQTQINTTAITIDHNIPKEKHISPEDIEIAPLLVDQSIEKDAYFNQEESKTELLLKKGNTSSFGQRRKLGPSIARFVKQRLLNVGDPAADQLKGKELLAVVIDKLDENTKTDISYAYIAPRRRVVLSIGKFKISRTKRR